ncbi:MAG: peptidylprolyl isomerase [Sulfurimonas sp.]|nr:peptidylprolyl isomerase [Sulfurimonas sp.]
MKLFLKITIPILVSLVCLNASPVATLEKNVVAMVNGVKIQKSELDRGVKRLFPARYFHKTVSDDKIKVFEKEVLDGLVDRELLIQYAKSIDIKVSQDVIDKGIEHAKKNLKSTENFNEALRKAGYTLKTFKELYYNEELLKKLYEKKINVNLSEDDLLKYYEKNKYKFKEPEKIEARVIYVRIDPTIAKGKSNAKQRIQEAYQKLKDGEDFSDVAAKYSTAMSRIKGGDLGYIHRGMLEPGIEKKAFSMDANTTSEIMEETIGFYIVKVEKILEPNQLPFEAIEKKLKKDLKKKTEKERKSNLLKKLKSTAVIVK